MNKLVLVCEVDICTEHLAEILLFRNIKSLRAYTLLSRLIIRLKEKYFPFKIFQFIYPTYTRLHFSVWIIFLLQQENIHRFQSKRWRLPDDKITIRIKSSATSLLKWQRIINVGSETSFYRLFFVRKTPSSLIRNSQETLTLIFNRALIFQNIYIINQPTLSQKDTNEKTNFHFLPKGTMTLCHSNRD